MMRQIIAVIIIKLLEKDLSAICNKTIAIYDNIGQGRIGKKAPTNHRIINIIQIMISAISTFWMNN